MEITADVDIEEVRKRLGVGKHEALRESERRRRFLQGFSRLITPTRPTLKLSSNIPTAMVDQTGDEPRIYVTTRRFPQPLTEYSDDVYDLMVQEALTVHEIGHVLYTHGTDFVDRIEELPDEQQGFAKRIWNALEDGAIEEQLCATYRVAPELEVLNANTVASDPIGYQKLAGDVADGPEIDNPDRPVDREGPISCTLFQAVMMGCLDMAVYDSGRFSALRDRDDTSVLLAAEADYALLDEIVPEMRDVVTDVKTEPNSIRRNERIFEFWAFVWERLEEAESPGTDEASLSEALNSAATGDSGDGDSGGQQTAPVTGKPDDTEIGGDDPSEASALDYESTSDRAQEQADAAGDPEGETSNAEERAENAEERSAEEMASDTDGEETVSQRGQQTAVHDDEVEAEFREEIASEVTSLDGGQALLDEVEQFIDVLGDGASNEFNGVCLEVPELADYDVDKWSDTERRGRRIARILKNRFQHSHEDDVLYKRTRGRLDQRGMISGERGRTNIFTRVQESERKDYDAILVLDRSGSMGGKDVQIAERSLASLAYAFELLGINVCVMDLYQSTARLVHAFGQEMSQTRGNVLSGEANGGTPLAEIVYLARKRVLENDSNPFMVVVTDGRPGNREQYIDQLEACTFPVLGVYVNHRRGDDADYFHRQVHVDDADQIDTAVTGLAEEVIDSALIDLSKGVNF